MMHLCSKIARLLQELPAARLGGIFTGINQPSGKLPGESFDGGTELADK